MRQSNRFSHHLEEHVTYKISFITHLPQVIEDITNRRMLFTKLYIAFTLASPLFKELRSCSVQPASSNEMPRWYNLLCPRLREASDCVLPLRAQYDTPHSRSYIQNMEQVLQMLLGDLHPQSCTVQPLLMARYPSSTALYLFMHLLRW
jgi:hypothetical protein